MGRSGKAGRSGEIARTCSMVAIEKTVIMALPIESKLVRGGCS